MQGNGDISSCLAYEIKKELAERYFGFRKYIEENEEALAERIRNQSLTLEYAICLDLGRIYILLGDSDLIREFFLVAGLEMEPFYDPFLLESHFLKSIVLSDVKPRGLTRSARFRNLLFDSYAILENHVARYRQQYSEHLIEEAHLKEEISLFYRKHDIGVMIDFLRALDNDDMARALNNEICPDARASLAQKMQLPLPCPVDKILPLIPPIVPLPRIKKELKKLARQAMKLHGRSFPDRIKRPL